MKFSKHFSLNNISVEFEDEGDPSRNSWTIKKIFIFDQTLNEGEYRDVFEKPILLKIIQKIHISIQLLTLILILILILNQAIVFAYSKRE